MAEDVGKLLIKALDEFAVSIGMTIAETEPDYSKEAQDIVKEGTELLERIKQEQQDADEKIVISNMNAFGKEIKASIEEYEKCQAYEDGEWAQSINVNDDYDFTVIKNKKEKKINYVEVPLDNLLALTDKAGLDRMQVLQELALKYENSEGGNK